MDSGNRKMAPHILVRRRVKNEEMHMALNYFWWVLYQSV